MYVGDRLWEVGVPPHRGVWKDAAGKHAGAGPSRASCLAPRVSFLCELSLGGQRVCELVLTQQHVPLSPSLSAVRHDKNPGSGLLLEATSFTPGRETQGLCRGDPPLPHPVQEIHRATGSRAPPDGQEPEKVGPGKPPPPAPTSTPARRRQPQAPAEAAFLRKTQEMYVRAILLVCLTIRPHVSRWYF